MNHDNKTIREVEFLGVVIEQEKIKIEKRNVRATK